MLNTVKLCFLIGIALASIGLWSWVFRRPDPTQTILENRRRDSSPIGLTDVLLMFASWIVAQTMALGILNAMNISVFDSENFAAAEKAKSLLVLGGCQLFATLACLAFYFVRYKRSAAMSLQPSWLGKDMRIGFIAFLMIIPPVLLIQMGLSIWVPYGHETLETLQEAESGWLIFSTWFSAVLVAPVVEEFFFRGVLQNWLQRLGRNEPESFNQIILGGYINDEKAKKPSGEIHEVEQVYFDSRLRWLPIVVTSGMFAALHLGQGAAPVPLFFLSLGLGYLYRQTGSILPCILVHVLLNFQTMFWLTLGITFG